MKPPRLTFFVELPGDELVKLFDTPGVTAALVRGGFALSIGIIDLSPERASVIRDLEGRGVPVTAWLLLDTEDGYWLNADNGRAARDRYRATMDWAERWGLALRRVGLDIEFPRADGELLLRSPRRGLWTLLRRRRSRQAVRDAESAYASLVEEIRAGGRAVETYCFPQLLDERIAASHLLRRTLGLVDVAADVEVYMLYASYLGRTMCRSYYGEAQGIAVGVTGGGVHADEPDRIRRPLAWEDLEQSLLAAREVTRDLYVFSLEGCVERDMLERLLRFDWGREPAALDPSALRHAHRRRKMLRTVLRTEPVLDLLLPSVRPG